jgi:HAD superfamily hydrolase (TIGR01490 family)
MSRPFAVFDIDGTLVRWQLFHAIVDTLAAIEEVDPAHTQNIKDARAVWKRREHIESFKEYEIKLINIYNQILLQVNADQFNNAITQVFEEFKDQVYIYTRDLITKLKTENYLLFAISGSQTEIVQLIADYYGFDDCAGSDYIQKDGKFTGESVLHIGKKHKKLEELVNKHKVNYKNSLAIGDSAGDISLLEAVENPIAFNPDKALYKVACKNNWSIILEVKNMIYKLEKTNGRYIVADTKL